MSGSKGISPPALTSTNYLLRCKAAPAILLIFVTIQQYDQTSLTPFNDGSAISE